MEHNVTKTTNKNFQTTEYCFIARSLVSLFSFVKLCAFVKKFCISYSGSFGCIINLERRYKPNRPNWFPIGLLPPYLKDKYSKMKSEVLSSSILKLLQTILSQCAVVQKVHKQTQIQNPKYGLILSGVPRVSFPNSMIN